TRHETQARYPQLDIPVASCLRGSCPRPAWRHRSMTRTFIAWRRVQDTAPPGRSISEMPETGSPDYNEPTGFWPVAGLASRANDPEAVLRLRSSPLITQGRQDESRHRRLRDGRFGIRLRSRDAWRRPGNRPCGPE